MSDPLFPDAIARNLEAGRKASNLAFALRVLPRERRADALTFYRFCRTLDDIADSPDLAPAERERALDAWAAAIANGLPANIEAMVVRHGIDRALLAEILAGVRADLTITRYATFADARLYCWRVAGAVGLVSIRIFGCTDPRSSAYAESLGLALQWTNILRDLREDATNGRIYLPQDEMARFRVDESALLAGRPSGDWSGFLEFQADRATGFFNAAQVPPTDHAALRPAEIMRAFYATLLARMRRDGFRVLEKRYRLSRAEKLWIAARTLISFGPAAGSPLPATTHRQV